MIAASTYISNYLFAYWQNDYQNLNATPSPVIHYWSLAVEEQFYVFWPIFIFTLYKIGSRRFVAIGIFCASVLSLIFSIYLTGVQPIWAFYSLPTRAWELGVGALLLFLPKRKFSPLLTWIGFIAIFMSTILYSERTPFPGYQALLPVLGTAVVIFSIGTWPPIFNDLGNLKIVQWMGEISYPLYLWHWPLLVFPSTYLGRPLLFYEKVLCILITIFLADITHRFLERPLRTRNFSQTYVFRTALVGTVLCVMLGASISVTHRSEVKLSNGFLLSLSQISEKPKVYLDDCHVNNGEVRSKECSYGDLTSSRTIVLYGDSHAAQWFPALEKLAKERSFRLVSLTKSACPGPDVIKVESGAYKNWDCAQWRKNSLERIRKIKPDAVVVSGYQSFAIPNKFRNWSEWWLPGEARTFKSLEGSAGALIYISDTPHPLRDIPNCLTSGKIERCDTTEKSDSRVGGNWLVINPTPWLCSDICPAIVDGIVAYRDASHISVKMSEHLSKELGSKLREFGVL